MKKKLTAQEVVEARRALLNHCEELIETAKGEGREFTAEENQQFEDNFAAVRRFDKTHEEEQDRDRTHGIDRSKVSCLRR